MPLDQYQKMIKKILYSVDSQTYPNRNRKHKDDNKKEMRARRWQKKKRNQFIQLEALHKYKTKKIQNEKPQQHKEGEYLGEQGTYLLREDLFRPFGYR